MTGGLSTYLVILIAGWMATDVWRLLGVAFSVRLNAESPVLKWVRAVSTALVAGLIAKLVIYAPGELADVALWVRLSAVAAGCAAYLAAGGNVFAGVVAAEAMLLGGILFLT
ncbi:AzlD domain-containing protein [Lutibaculum baratangense]|uniref:Branched-chain amino acid transport n=1 Tax=Lutibaculum baratangense AMV1 TaxID=631454 RepID=V4RBQ1_9HYPH|nr:AzlD domain-containing protein [Lutibaculum baratangense]ESR23581.1 hypothetical protein N177_3649 [Lutibaculum baratangense AMV1]